MEMQNWFTTVLNMSITGSVVIVCVMLARLVLKKAPKVYAYALWAVVLFRLLCPVSVSAPVSVLNAVDAPEPKRDVGTVEYVPVPIQTPKETEYAGEAHIQVAAPSAEPTAPVPIDWNLISTWVWAVGAAALAAHGTISYVNLKRKLREAAFLEDGVKEADGLKSPFVLGFLRPVIYLPSDLPEPEREYILLHEKYHVQRMDHLVRAAFYGALCLHWFNPLVWAAFVLAGKDMEMSCDEAVLKKLGGEIRCDYSASLLRLATGRQIIAGAPLAFGEGDTKGRIKNVLKWKKPGILAAVIGTVICATVNVGCALNPAQEPEGTNETTPPTQTTAPTQITEATEPVAPSTAPEPVSVTKLVRMDTEDFRLELELPEGWDCRIDSYTPGDTGAGITFWPEGYELSGIHLGYYDGMFGVCGTGLEEEQVTLENGTEVYVGYYDGRSYWSFIAFPGGKLAATTEGSVQLWWDEYGEDAMKILATVRVEEGRFYVSMEESFATFVDSEGKSWDAAFLTAADRYALMEVAELGLVLAEYEAGEHGYQVLSYTQGEAAGQAPVSINCLEKDGEYIYFGSFGENYREDLLHLEDESGNCTILQGGAFVWVFDAPLVKAELWDNVGRVIVDDLAKEAVLCGYPLAG